jgi:hypothetical protein
MSCAMSAAAAERFNTHIRRDSSLRGGASEESSDVGEAATPLGMTPSCNCRHVEE